MKHIIGTMLMAALLTGAQGAWPAMRDRHERVPGPLVESPFPADAESSFALRPFGSDADERRAYPEGHAGEPFPATLTGVMIGG